MEIDTSLSAWISSSPIKYVFHRSWVSIRAMVHYTIRRLHM
jgi:hypothetical protein